MLSVRLGTALARTRAIITQGDLEAILGRSAGHLADTALPITCFPFSYLDSAPNRFTVRARQAEVDVR